MQLAKLMINKNSGEIIQYDSTFEDWLKPLNGHELRIDDYFAPLSGNSMSGEVQARLKKGKLHYVGINSKFSYNSHDQFLCLLDSTKLSKDETIPLTIIPIDEEEHLHENLSEIAPQVFDSITDFLVICKPDYTIVRANKAAKAVYGGLEDIEGKKCYKVLRGKDSPCEDCPLPETLETGKMSPNDYFDPELKEFIETRTFPHINEKNYWTHFTILSRIVSKRREEEGETAQNKKLQALGQMASGVAHDFNNMLTIILGRVQLLKSRLSDPGMLSNLKTIEKAALDSTDIVHRLQDFTRKKNSNGEVEFEPVDINLIVQDVVSYASTRIDKARRQLGIKIQIETQLREVQKIDGNKTQLRSALLNLIFNAIDAMEIGGMINIWTQQLGSKLEIGVSDTGKGMPKEVREKMFDPFFSTKGEKGNGLGLSEVYGIINLHNGTIEVDSTPGEGTTISLFLPISSTEFSI